MAQCSPGFFFWNLCTCTHIWLICLHTEMFVSVCGSVWVCVCSSCPDTHTTQLWLLIRLWKGLIGLDWLFWVKNRQCWPLSKGIPQIGNRPPYTCPPMTSCMLPPFIHSTLWTSRLSSLSVCCHSARVVGGWQLCPSEQENRECVNKHKAHR